MSDHPPVSAPGVAESHRGLRAVALVAVIIGVLVLAAAAFLLSYSGIHAIARTAGVTPSLARLYPLILDAMLVIACAAVLSLRGAGLAARCYAWLSLLVLLAAVAGADALHATGTKLPQRPAAAAVAIIPWALLLIGFGLLLSMLRHARQRMIAAQQVPVAPTVGQDQQRIGINDLLTPRAPEPGPAVRSVPRPELTAPAVVAAPVTPARPAAATPASVTSPPDAATPDITSPAEATSAAGAARTQSGQRRRAAALPRRPAPQSRPALPRRPAPQTGRHETPARRRGHAASRGRAARTEASTTDEAAPTQARAADEASAADGADSADQGADQGADLAIDSEPEQDDPTSDEASLASQPAAAWVPQARAELPAQDEVAYSGGNPATGLSPAPTADYAAGAYATSSRDTAAYDTATYDAPTHDTATHDAATHDAAGGEPTGAAAQDQPAEPAPPAQPEPAVLPQFLRKRSSPTPPED